MLTTQLFSIIYISKTHLYNLMTTVSGVVLKKAIASSWLRPQRSVPFTERILSPGLILPSESAGSRTNVLIVCPRMLLSLLRRVNPNDLLTFVRLTSNSCKMEMHESDQYFLPSYH